MITNQPKWKIVEYSRSQIIKAGKTIKKEDAPEREAAQATKIIDNWRAAHAFPMHVIYMHLRRMAAWKFMISNTAVGTADIIRSHLWE